MATVPSGWAYWDKSANKVIEAGGTIPTPAAGDMYYGVTSSENLDYNKLWYVYSNSETRHYINYDTKYQETTSFILPAGWYVSNENYTMTSATVASSIGGKNVVAVKLFNNVVSKITSLNLPNTVVMVWLNDNPNITTVTGSLGSALKEFTCWNSPKLRSVPAFANATNLTNCIKMFQGCTALTNVPSLPPNTVSLFRAFERCTSIASIPTIPSKVVDMAYLCNECINLTTAPSNNSTVALYMQYVFAECSKLEDASNFNIPASAKILWYMFNNCSKLKKAPPVIRGNDASCYYLFQGCTSLVTPPSFEGTYTNMNTMFYKCSSLKTAPIIPNGSQTMSWAFAECTSLEEVPYIPSTVNSLYYCFYKCTSLTWVSMRLNNNYGCSYNYMFAGCTNLTGIIYLGNSYVPPCNHMFYDTTKTIIIGGTETCANAVVAQQNNNNVYRWLNTNYTNISSVRTDINGTPDDAGEYMQLSIDFTCPVVDYSKLYVPKVYIKNNQIAPLQNWVLTYINEQETKIVKEIENSTDIEAVRIEANDVVASGNFTTIFSANELSEGVALTIYIPASNSQVATDWDNSNHQYVIGTVYWNGTSGSAIFTGETFIFDALPDGTAFKIGGPVYEDETGFIVGNANSTPYPSTFNGAATVNGAVTINGTAVINEQATFNDNVYIAVDINAGSGNVDYEIYTALHSLGWDTGDDSVIV